MARTKSGRFTKRRKSTRRNGLTRRQKAARKAARTRKRNKAAKRSARRRSGKRRVSRKASVRRSPRRARRSGRRRARSRRKPGGHFRTYRSLSRRYGPKRAGRMWRKKRKYVRSNPFTGLIPSVSNVKELVTTGAVAYLGFVGVNAGLAGLDKIGLGTLKAKLNSTIGTALVNAAARILLTGIVAKVGGKVGLNAKSLALGGAFNVIYHGVQDVVASNPAMIPDAAKPMLLGYDGFGDWVEVPGMNDWVATPGMGLLPEPIDPGTTLA